MQPDIKENISTEENLRNPLEKYEIDVYLLALWCYAHVEGHIEYFIVD